MRDDPDRSHHATISYIRGFIQESNRREKLADIDTLDTATVAYIKAKTMWSTLDNDKHMINLVGTWARVSRIIMQMEEKYRIWE